MAKNVRIPAFAELVRSLRPNESLSRSQRISLEDAGDGDARDALARLRNQVNQAVSKTRREEGSYFKVESGSFITDDSTAIICTVAVTRLSGEERPLTADDEEDDI